MAREDHAFALRQYLRREWEPALLPAMERAFDDLDVPDRTVHFSRLEITVRVGEKYLEDDLPALIYQEVAGRLRDMLHWGEGTHDNPRPARGSTMPEDRLETLLHYLRTGSLPWAASFAGDHDPAGDLRGTCRLEMKRLVELLHAGAAHAGDMVPFLFRLLQLLSGDDLRAFIIAVLEGDPAVSSAGAARAAEMIAGTGGGARSLHERLHAGAEFLAASLRGVEITDDPHSAAAREVAAPRETRSLPPVSHGDALVSLLSLLGHIIVGDAPLSAGSVPPELPTAWRERFAGVIAGTDSGGDTGATGSKPGAAGRDERLHLAASLLAGCLRDAGGSVSGSARAVQALAFLLDAMAGGELRRFVQRLTENLPLSWKADAVQLVEAVVEGRNILLARDGRLRLASALLIESLRNAAGSAAPDLGVVREVLRAEEGAALAAIGASLPASALLPANRAHGDADAAARTDGSTRTGAETDVPDGSRDNRHNHNESHHDGPGSRRASLHDTVPDDGTPISVHLAGLILLHPFISSFLRNTGVMDARGRELPESALPKAAALLHFLATGHEDVHEFELDLCKLLLGCEIDDPLPVASGLILPEDIEEAESLLASVIEHWSILKGTAVEGFRRSFLQRRGLLRRGDRAWRLQVEPAAFDMLLDQLPWGISIVRLPWMPEPIQVEWERV